MCMYTWYKRPKGLLLILVYNGVCDEVNLSIILLLYLATQVLTSPVLCPPTNGESWWSFLSLKASLLLLGSVRPRSWRIEWHQLLVTRGERVMWCAILSSTCDSWINSMSRPGAYSLLENCGVNLHKFINRATVKIGMHKVIISNFRATVKIDR